ncbi:MAG: TIGR04283 family arsenosugar biosynthesis glycosyltransferase [Thermodesulfobacteriota bacterium]
MFSVSVIIPVLNEEKIINSLISDLKVKLVNSDHEIIVSDGDPKGSTIKNIKDPDVVKTLSKKGRAAQMNNGALKASKSILLFLHADSVLPDNFLNSVKKIIINKNASAGAFDLKIDSSRFIFQIIEKSASLRSRITKIPYGDQGIFIRKDIFENLNRFSDIPIMEDIDLMLRLKRKKYRAVISRQKIKTSPRRWEKEGIVYCTIRNLILSTLFYCGADPSKLAEFYR